MQFIRTSREKKKVPNIMSYTKPKIELKIKQEKYPEQKSSAEEKLFSMTNCDKVEDCMKRTTTKSKY
eukprot:2866271-Ditylum_brightwellii.AAC.1